MPTYETTPSFLRDWGNLDERQQARFRTAVKRFVRDLAAGRVRSGSRVRGFEGRPGVFEFRWAPDGRALFSYGAERRPGDPHVVWHRVGSHDIYDEA